MDNDRVILIDKPAGMTSFGVVARVRRVMSERAGMKVKVGHCGTLDPFATGLLIIVTGKQCRNAGLYSKLDKTYDAEIILGTSSSTGDPEGELTVASDVVPTLEAARGALARLTGEITQTPPIYSAIKIDGQRAYKHARAGRAIEMPARTVTVHTLELIDYDYPVLRIRTRVSSGTYIRTLAEDIGKLLGTGAYTRNLRRLDIDDKKVSNAVTLEKFMTL